MTSTKSEKTRSISLKNGKKVSHVNKNTKFVKRSPTLRAIIPWTGGKHTLKNTLVMFLPKYYHTYIEPFAGAASMLFALKPKRAIVNDINPWLMLIYFSVQQDPLSFLNMLDKIKPKKVNDYSYVKILNHFNKNRISLENTIPNDIQKITESDYKMLLPYIAEFYFIVKYSFGGHIWIEDDGYLNSYTHESKIVGRHLYNEQLIMNIHKYLSENDIQFYHGNYKKILSKVKPNDFIYFDPPYYNSNNANNIAKYSKDIFTNKDHDDLKKVCDKITQLKAKFMMSNSYHPSLIKIFNSYKIQKVAVRRTLFVRKEHQEKGCSEVIIVNY